MQDLTANPPPDSIIEIISNAAMQIFEKLPFEPILIFSIIFPVAALLVGYSMGTTNKLAPLRLLRIFFYSEQEQELNSTEKLLTLKDKIEHINKLFNSKDLEQRQEAIAQELDNQLTRDLPQLIARKLEEINALDNFVSSEIKQIIEISISNFLTKQEPAQLLLDREALLRSEERKKRCDILEDTIQEQTRSSGRLKSVMINLFVVFNFGIIFTYIFAGSTLTDKAITGIIGLYISLAAFIVYIYRTSNFRSSVLLALREDAKKYFDAAEYIRRLKPGASPTERDVEVLKLLLLNRAEREKMADHPYEVILKGVSNSNIQLKGGKMLSSAKVEKAK